MANGSSWAAKAFHGGGKNDTAKGRRVSLYQTKNQTWWTSTTKGSRYDARESGMSMYQYGNDRGSNVLGDALVRARQLRRR